MTTEQNLARNEAYQLIKIAMRILADAKLEGYENQLSATAAQMAADAKAGREQWLNKRLPA